VCSCADNPTCPCTGDKLREELSSTKQKLTVSQAKEEAAASEGETLRVTLGGMKQQMAKAAAELEKQTQTAEEMRARVSKLNQNFMQTSEWLRLCAGSSNGAAIAVAVFA
jgi:predicted  nucleic acid-binding Zn-ribbon protein